MFKYYISFVDAHTRYIWIYFLRGKSKTYRDVTHFSVQVEKQVGYQLKILQTDDGTEFKPFNDLFKKKEYMSIYV